MIETQLAWLAASLPSSESGGIPGQPKPTRENLKLVTTRGGKTTRDPPYLNPTGKKQKEVIIEPEEEEDTEKVAPDEEKLRKTSSHDFFDTALLPFPQRTRSLPWMSNSESSLR
jgi:hypothetical protein